MGGGGGGASKRKQHKKKGLFPWGHWDPHTGEHEPSFTLKPGELEKNVSNRVRPPVAERWSSGVKTADLIASNIPTRPMLRLPGHGG